MKTGRARGAEPRSTSSERGELEAQWLRLRPQSLRRPSGQSCSGREAEGGGRGAEVERGGRRRRERGVRSGFCRQPPGSVQSSCPGGRAAAAAEAAEPERGCRGGGTGGSRGGGGVGGESRRPSRASRSAEPCPPKPGPASQPCPARAQPCAPPAESGRLKLRPPPAAPRFARG